MQQMGMEKGSGGLTSLGLCPSMRKCFSSVVLGLTGLLA